MKRHAAGLALAGLFAAAPPAGDVIDFHPEEGSAVTKAFHTEITFVLEDAEVFLNGAETDPAMVGIPADLEVSVGYEVECLDRYEVVAGSRVTELLRTFETFEFWSVDPEGEEDREPFEEVIDRSVRFSWDEDEGAYAASFDGDGEDGDEETLALLHQDLDLRGLVPEGEVDEGESWEVSGEALHAVLLPGLRLTGDPDWGDDDAIAALMDALGRLGAGAATCSYNGDEEDDGRTLAVIDFAFAAEDGFEVDPDAFGFTAEAGGAELDDALLEVFFELEFEGRCLWDVTAGRFHSFEMGGEGSIVLDAALSLESAGFELETSAEFAIDLQRTATAD